MKAAFLVGAVLVALVLVSLVVQMVMSWRVV